MDAPRRAVTRSALGTAGQRACSNWAPLRFVAYEDLQAEIYWACRILNHQATTIEGVKR